MRVKRLEVQGFKSFKDKTAIHFDHRITGVVGPNGCGKSNIVDAFFWVMGEQSFKHMRSSGSQDLIFNGSSKYTPLGMAEATLIMDTDFAETSTAPTGATTKDIPVHLRAKEVAVTRRVYRSGEGEYFINGVPARLKDIQELFMDTGVGAKGYSVIEQGQIDRVVNSKPEDRKRLIEEAAGIAKYKARKKESLRKMEAAQANLGRLNDIIQEIERSLASLERQAQKARKYKEYKSELTDKELTWGRRKLLIFTQKLDAVKKEKDALEHELVLLRTELHSAEAKIETIRISQVTDSSVAQELQEIIQSKNSSLAQEQSALDLSKKRQEDLESQIQSLKLEHQNLEQSLSNESKVVEEKEIELVESESNYEQASARAREFEANLKVIRSDLESVRRDLESVRIQLMEDMSDSSRLKSNIASKSAFIESAEQQLSKYAIQETELLQKTSESKKSLDDVQAQVEILKAKKQDAKEQMEAKREIISALQVKLSELKKQNHTLMRELTEQKSRLKSLEELAAAYEGLADGPKAILEWAKERDLTGKFGVVTDLFEVNKGFEGALTGWLESKIDDLFTADTSSAVEAVKTLKDQKKGRAAVHLTRLFNQEGDSSSASMSTEEVKAQLSQQGFDAKGALSEFVKVASFNSNSQDLSITFALSKLISKVFVVESLEPLSSLDSSQLTSILQGWSLIALDGTALTSDGILRGGSSQLDHTASILMRKRAMQELQVQVDQMQSDYDQALAVTTQTESELKDNQEWIDQARSELQQTEVQLAGSEGDLKRHQATFADAERSLSRVTRERDDLKIQVDQAKESSIKFEAELADIESRRIQLEEKIATDDQELSQNIESLKVKENELSELKIAEVSLRERASSLRREIESTKSYISSREKRLEEVNRTLGAIAQERDGYSDKDNELGEKISDLIRTLGTEKEKLSLLRDKLEQESTELNAALDTVKTLHKETDQKSQKISDIALNAEKMNGEMNHLVQNLEEKYGVGCFQQTELSPIQEEMTEPVVTREMTAEEEQILFEEVESLRERIRRLGEVNTMAVEEYEELKGRHEHLITERGDLQQSISNLQDAIDHINKTSEVRFKQAFDAIADRFSKLFPVVFGGGQAHLSLVYPEGTTDILDAGVDIYASPPGKKVVNIGLLSGGEKALTAISLVFAIFMVKPSPFCILDEVDAPLDDSNIGKFNALLREMASKTQFIIITHNKKTMELNDTLYGVTMEEPGVSKMVSIEMQ